MKKLSKTMSCLINLIFVILFLFLGNCVVTDLELLTRAQTTIIMQIGIYVILATSLNLIIGNLDELYLGQAGFMAIGAYVSSLFWKSKLIIGVPSFIIGILLGSLVAGLIGYLIAHPIFKIKGDYLSIMTLGFSEIIRVTLINLKNITEGAQGLKGIPKFSGFLNIYIPVLICCTILHLIMKSKFGRAFRSIGDNEIATMSCGIDTKKHKILALVIFSSLSAVAGALYATTQGVIAPNEFGFLKSIDVIVMVVLGGIGSTIGSIFAAILLTALPLFLQNLMQNFNDYRMLVYSIILILIMVFKPEGLFGKYDFSLRQTLYNLISKKAKPHFKGKTL